LSKQDKHTKWKRGGGGEVEKRGGGGEQEGEEKEEEEILGRVWAEVLSRLPNSPHIKY
jgi:hypothetical protein